MVRQRNGGVKFRNATQRHSQAWIGMGIDRHRKDGNGKAWPGEDWIREGIARQNIAGEVNRPEMLWNCTELLRNRSAQVSHAKARQCKDTRSNGVA